MWLHLSVHIYVNCVILNVGISSVSTTSNKLTLSVDGNKTIFFMRISSSSVSFYAKYRNKMKSCFFGLKFWVDCYHCLNASLLRRGTSAKYICHRKERVQQQNKDMTNDKIISMFSCLWAFACKYFACEHWTLS